MHNIHDIHDVHSMHSIQETHNMQGIYIYDMHKCTQHVIYDILSIHDIHLHAVDIIHITCIVYKIYLSILCCSGVYIIYIIDMIYNMNIV